MFRFIAAGEQEWLPGTVRTVHAREAEGAERERLWRRGVRVYPGWNTFQRRASNRRIPVMVLASVTWMTARKN
ncbi:MAG: nitroreductase/quinone reductase family protein [Rubrobacteraceae bacterium]